MAFNTSIANLVTEWAGKVEDGHKEGLQSEEWGSYLEGDLKEINELNSLPLDRSTNNKAEEEKDEDPLAGFDFEDSKNRLSNHPDLKESEGEEDDDLERDESDLKGYDPE